MILQRAAIVVSVCALVGCTHEAPPRCPASHEDQVRRVAGFTMEQTWDDWGWNTGVALSGIVAAWECTGDETMLDAVREWTDAQMVKGVSVQQVNGIAPGPALLALYEHDADEAYLDLAVELGDLLVEDYPKLDRAFVHTPGQLWVDTTFMSAPFLAELGRVTGDATYTELGVDQVIVHGDRLQRDDGLWNHGWDQAAFDAGQDPVNGIMWGRGNGWAAGATVELLERLPDDHPRIDELEQRLAAQLEAVLALQAAEGGWHTVLDAPATYLESSGSAMLARGLVVARRRGLLDVEDDAVDAAFAYLDAETDADGRLHRVSGPTVLSNDPTYYASRPVTESEPYAQGSLLLLLTEPW